MRVNIFAPGFIETEATLGREDWTFGRGDQLRSMTPMGHIAGPADIAGAALFLATDEANRITGTCMVEHGRGFALSSSSRRCRVFWTWSRMAFPCWATCTGP